MKSLAISQMEAVGGGRFDEGAGEGGDFWHDAAVWFCGLWAVGRVFFDIAITAEGSPLATAIINGMIDAFCAGLGVHELATN